jgi:hypothetical protein
MSPAAAIQSAFLTLPGNPWFWASFMDFANALEGWAGRGIPEWVVPTRVLSYTARKPRYDPLGQPLLDAQGDPLCDRAHLSGRVFFPPAWRARQAGPLPVVVYTHGTNLRKDTVPSLFGGHEWVFGAAAAIYYGLVVVMPDLPGMGGDSCAYHPYCHRRSLAYALVDALPEVRRMLEEDPGLQGGDYRWDPRLFLMGYSEGGYASLAAARELETLGASLRAGTGFELAGTVSMGAPYNLSRVTLKAFLGDRPSPHCFYLPCIVLGYQAVYGRIIDPLEIFAPVLLESREDGNVLQWAAGGLDLLRVDLALARRLGVRPGEVVLRRLFNPDWVAIALDRPDLAETPLGRILRENDLPEGWAPARPILIAHSPDDRDVPMDNAVLALETLAGAVRREGRDPTGLLELRLLGKPGEGVGHVAATVPGLAAAFGQIQTWRAKD